jgi:type VI secretion system protein ImpK
MQNQEDLSTNLQTPIDATANADSDKLSLTAAVEQNLKNPLSAAEIEQLVYTSQVFTSNNNANLLVAAAAPIFAIATRLRAFPSPPTDKNQFLETLVQEIRAFHSKATQHNYSENTCLAARYILCTFLDEMVLATSWGNDYAWREHNLLKTFHQDSNGAEQFFVLLDLTYRNSAQDLDLLELIYLCLCLGFMGRYKNRENAALHLARIQELLYKRLRQLRGETTTSFFIQEDAAEKELPPITKKPFFAWWPIWTMGAATIFILFMMYVFFHSKLSV